MSCAAVGSVIEDCVAPRVERQFRLWLRKTTAPFRSV